MTKIKFGLDRKKTALQDSKRLLETKWSLTSIIILHLNKTRQIASVRVITSKQEKALADLKFEIANLYLNNNTVCFIE